MLVAIAKILSNKCDIFSLRTKQALNATEHIDNERAYVPVNL